MVVGLDINEEEGKKTQKMARDIGGQMIFIKTDLTKDEDIEHSLTGAAMLGTIHDLVYIADLVIHSAGHSLRTLCQPQVFAPKGK